MTTISVESLLVIPVLLLALIIAALAIRIAKEYPRAVEDSSQMKKSARCAVGAPGSGDVTWQTDRRVDIDL